MEGLGFRRLRKSTLGIPAMAFESVVRKWMEKADEVLAVESTTSTTTTTSAAAPAAEEATHCMSLMTKPSGIPFQNLGSLCFRCL